MLTNLKHYGQKHNKVVKSYQMMNRNEYRARKKRRSYGESNQERRTKALEVYRKVDKDTSGSLAAGIIAMLGNAHESDNFPQLKKIEHTHRLQILDALSVKNRFGQGFEAGYNFRQAMEDIRQQCISDGTGLTATINKVSVIGFKQSQRLIVAEMTSDWLDLERVAVRRSLGDAGMKGFMGTGRKSFGVIQLPLAQSLLHIPSAEEVDEIVRKGRTDPSAIPMSQPDFVDEIEKMLNTGGLIELPLGDAVVKAHK